MLTAKAIYGQSLLFLMSKVHRVQLWIFVHVLNKLVSLMTFCSYQYVGRISAERGSCLSSARVKTLISSFIDRRITQQENRVSCITMTFTLTSVHLQVSSSPLYHQLRTSLAAERKFLPAGRSVKTASSCCACTLDYHFAVVISRQDKVLPSSKENEVQLFTQKQYKKFAMLISSKCAQYSSL